MKNTSITRRVKRNIIVICSRTMILDYMKKLKLSMKQIYKEVAMELNFIKCGDYYIPDIKLRNPNIRLGKWGRMRKTC